eukprot:507637-Hanusia_phi.AAC.1
MRSELSSKVLFLSSSFSFSSSSLLFFSSPSPLFLSFSLRSLTPEHGAPRHVQEEVQELRDRVAARRSRLVLTCSQRDRLLLRKAAQAGWDEGGGGEWGE